MKIIFLIGLFVMFPIMAYSSDWKCIYYPPPIASNAGECQAEMDTASVKYLPEGYVRVWVSTKLFHGDKRSTWRTDLYEIDCVDKKWRFLQIGFDALEDSVPPEGPSPWYWTEPDSPENDLSEAVCKHKK